MHSVNLYIITLCNPGSPFLKGLQVWSSWDSLLEEWVFYWKGVVGYRSNKGQQSFLKRTAWIARCYYMYINTWQSGLSFFKRTAGLMVMGFSSWGKGFLLEGGCGLLEVKGISPFQKGLPGLPGVIIYILTPGNLGCPFSKGLQVWSSWDSLLEEKVFYWKGVGGYWK